MINILIGIAAIVGTIAIYLFADKIHRKIDNPITIPVITATFSIVIILLIFHIPYETYMLGGEWINKLLGPAVVALAYPLYQQRAILKDLTFPILVGTFFGAFVGISTGMVLAKLAGFDALIIYSITAKNVTTPVAMAIADSIGGATPLAVIFVMIAGISGVVLCTTVFKWFRIDHYLGRGVGMGCSSHALGTATAFETSQLEGSVSTIAMVVSAVVVSILDPLLMAVWM